MNIRPSDILRYALWLGVINTANANRKYFGLPTTWVFHTAINSFILFFPEILQGTNKLLGLDERAEQKQDLVTTVHKTLQQAVVENPNYALYVSPVALAYIVSHPQFNIYKGDFANIRLLGFGLDALPHSLTAFTFTHLIADTLASFRRNTPPNASWHDLAVMADDHSEAVAGGFLVGASALYEAGEYAIHVEELRETGGDESKINLVWSAADTVFDIMSNTLGWLAAALIKQRRLRRTTVSVKKTEPNL